MPTIKLGPWGLSIKNQFILCIDYLIGSACVFVYGS